jgi:hypothetical protein
VICGHNATLESAYHAVAQATNTTHGFAVSAALNWSMSNRKRRRKISYTV